MMSNDNAIPRASIITSCFRGERYLADFLANVAEQTLFAETELVLVLNEPSETELALAQDFQARYPGRMQQLVVTPVEPQAASWNRAWRAARAPYCCIWNIDDQRTPESIAVQCAALDAHPAAPLVYGDQLRVFEYGCRIGWHEHFPTYDRERFTRAYFCGAFPMWRKSLAAEAGYFDEQLRSAGDFDFTVRLSLRGPLLKAPGILGYFTDIGAGLSTGNVLCEIERTVIELRYGIYETVDIDYLDEARKYQIDKLRFDGQWQTVTAWVPGYAALLAARQSTKAIMDRRLTNGQPEKARQQASLRWRAAAKHLLVGMRGRWARLWGRPC